MNQIEDWLTQPNELADRLRVLRTQAGLSGKDLAKATGWQPSKVSRLENGKQMPTPADLEAWARACRVEAEETHRLLGLLDEIQTTHRDWKRRMRRGQAAVQANYNDLIEQSTLVRHFETAYVPGLLQTAGYARRVLTEMVELHGLNIDDVDRAVMTRLQRQQHLYNSDKRFEFLLAEPVLRWALCTSDVMLGQLDRLQTVVGLPNVKFGIIPMSVPIATTPQNSFQLYDQLAIVETFLGETIHRADEAAAYARVMDLLWNQAATGEGARRLILQAAENIHQRD